MAQVEWQLQTKVFVYLRKALPIGSHVWGVDFPQVSPRLRLMMHARGVRAGVADLHVLSNGRYVALELKSPVGRTTDHQEVFGASLRSAGGDWFVIKTVEGARAALESVGIVCNPAIQVPLEIQIPTARTKKIRGAFA
jgi:hypothetical protein